MKVEPVTKICCLLDCLEKRQPELAPSLLANSVSLRHKVKTWTASLDWHVTVASGSAALDTLKSICRGRADRPAGKTSITTGLHLGGFKMLRNLRHLPSGTIPRPPFHWSPEERCGKRQQSTICLGKTTLSIRSKLELTQRQQLRNFPET